jgi:hypothetical protein
MVLYWKAPALTKTIAENKEKYPSLTFKNADYINLPTITTHGMPELIAQEMVSDVKRAFKMLSFVRESVHHNRLPSEWDLDAIGQNIQRIIHHHDEPVDIYFAQHSDPSVAVWTELVSGHSQILRNEKYSLKAGERRIVKVFKFLQESRIRVLSAVAAMAKDHMASLPKYMRAVQIVQSLLENAQRSKHRLDPEFKPMIERVIKFLLANYNDRRKNGFGGGVDVWTVSYKIDCELNQKRPISYDRRFTYTEIPCDHDDSDASAVDLDDAKRADIAIKWFAEKVKSAQVDDRAARDNSKPSSLLKSLLRSENKKQQDTIEKYQ